jgi:hypothetical protein
MQKFRHEFSFGFVKPAGKSLKTAQTKALAETLPFRLTDALIFGKLVFGKTRFPLWRLRQYQARSLGGLFAVWGRVPFRTKLTTRATQSLAAQVCE